MRRIEPPPARNPKWEFRMLLDAIPYPKYTELTEINDSSYPYWDKWKHLAAKWGMNPKMLWQVVKTSRGIGEKKVRFNSREKFLVKINTPSVVQEKLHQLDLSLGGSLHASNLIPSEEKHRYLVSSLMEEAIASSQLEGAATTRKIAREMLETNRPPANVSEQMIANNFRVMQWIVKNKAEKLTPSLILEIHHIITRDTLVSTFEEGAYRTSDDVKIVDVQTGHVLHTPPSHADLTELIVEFCRFANDSVKQDFFIHPIVKAITLHFLMGYIHPFTDGNGRTARAIFYWYLVKKGYWLIEYMSVSRIILGSKAQYARAYQYVELDDNDLTYFIIYNLKCIERALEELKKYIDRKNEEKKRLLFLLRNTAFNDRQMIMVQEMLTDEKSVFTVVEIQTKFGVSNQTARNDLAHFVEKQILYTRKSGKKNQFVLTEKGQTILRRLVAGK